MLWVLEGDEGDHNAWWSAEQGRFTSNFGDATIEAAESREDLPWSPHTWVALDMGEEWG